MKKERVPRQPDGRDDERDDGERRERPELLTGDPAQVGDPPRPVAERVRQPVVELLAGGHVPEAVPRARVRVDEGCAEPARAEDELEADEDRRDRSRKETCRDQARLPDDARGDRDDEQGDGRSEEQRERVVAGGEPESFFPTRGNEVVAVSPDLRTVAVVRRGDDHLYSLWISSPPNAPNPAEF